MQLIYGFKPLTEIERAFAAAKYKRLKEELWPCRLTSKTPLSQDEKRARKNAYLRMWYRRRKALRLR